MLQPHAGAKLSLPSGEPGPIKEHAPLHAAVVQGAATGAALPPGPGETGPNPPCPAPVGRAQPPPGFWHSSQMANGHLHRREIGSATYPRSPTTPPAEVADGHTCTAARGDGQGYGAHPPSLAGSLTGRLPRPPRFGLTPRRRLGFFFWRSRRLTGGAASELRRHGARGTHAFVGLRAYVLVCSCAYVLAFVMACDILCQPL